MGGRKNWKEGKFEKRENGKLEILSGDIKVDYYTLFCQKTQRKNTDNKFSNGIKF